MFVPRFIFLFVCFFSICAVYGQQDVDLHLKETFLLGRNVIKVKRDFNDPYLWVLAQGNQVYRINSITKVVDDYTSTFSAYNGLQFIDIAGVSENQVYVAANSANLIELKNGILKNISTADGLVGAINSIGIDYTGTYFSREFPLGSGPATNIFSVLIGTNTGMCHYDFTNGVMLPGSSALPARVFEATYRTEMFSDLEGGQDPDPVTQKLYPAVALSASILEGYVWYGNNSIYGNVLNTAYCTTGVVIDNMQAYYPEYFMDFYWGTENGLFQNFRGNSRGTGNAQNQYLKGINVNKITSIYGLRAFGSSYFANMIRENLLVGTNNGLYVSNSGYWQTNQATLPTYSFFHYAELGNKKINDINVNATSYNSAPICEDGVWVAAIDGLYLLQPDYVPYVDKTIKMQAIQFDGQPGNITELQTCGIPAAKAFVSNASYIGNSIKWYKDGVALPNENNTTLNITRAGDYYAVLYDPCSAANFETNHLKVIVLSAPVFTFNYPDKLSYCAGSTATLETENNTNYQYRWYQDGVLNGNTTSRLDITQQGKYKLEVSACSGSWVSTKEVQIDFIKVPPPIVTSDKTAYCAGSQAVLTASVPLDATGIVNWQPYQYQWYKDGVPLTANTSATLNATQPGVYKVEATSCSGNTGTSTGFQLDFITLAIPVISADKPAYCIGDQASLSIAIPPDNSYTIKWLKDGVVMNENQGKTTIVSSSPGSYTVDIFSNQATCSQSSAVYNLKFDDPPVINLERIVKTTLCDGQPVDLQATYSGGSIKWSTGETGDRITVKQSGTYTATVTTAAGCAMSQDLTLQFFSNPTLSLPDATLCQFTNDHLTLTAPPGFVKYKWNGQLGSQTYVTSTLGVVSLTVTDQNGCEATQTINVTSHCKDLHIPNAFTPNGDGINDKWVITGFEGDPTVNVKIFDRWGAPIFQSQGYTTPWDGTYRNKKISAGVYYYVIAAQGSKQVLSGSVTVIY